MPTHVVEEHADACCRAGNILGLSLRLDAPIECRLVAGARLEVPLERAPVAHPLVSTLALLGIGEEFEVTESGGQRLPVLSLLELIGVLVELALQWRASEVGG